MTQDQVESKYGPVVMLAASKSNPDREPYRVRMLGSHIACNCKAWVFCRKRDAWGDGFCRHTRAARDLVSAGELQMATKVAFSESLEDAYYQSKSRVDAEMEAESVQEETLLGKVLNCLGSLQDQVTSAMRKDLSRVLESVSPRRVVASSLVPLGGPRRIVFDD